MLFNCGAFPQCPPMARGPLHPVAAATAAVHVEFIFTISQSISFIDKDAGALNASLRSTRTRVSSFILNCNCNIFGCPCLSHSSPHPSSHPPLHRVIDTGVRLTQCACLRIYSGHSKSQCFALVLDKFVIILYL